MSTRSLAKHKSEMSQKELEKKIEEEFKTGPFSVLTQSVKNNTQVLIKCRNNKKILARVRAFDRHCNMVLENAKEFWTELPVRGKGEKKLSAVVLLTGWDKPAVVVIKPGSQTPLDLGA